jgi:hypothetical protein
MTWIVGVTAFNGVLCVADIQITIPYADSKREPIYRDCLKKIHRVWTNLYVGFSGDVRVGLNVIADFKKLVEYSFVPGTLFSLEGQLDGIQGHLKLFYENHAGGKVVDLQLMFIFVHQEGDSTEYQPALCRFIAPDFRCNSSGYLQLDQCGSGRNSKQLQTIADFLKGRGDLNDPIYKQIFPSAPDIPNFFTVKKARTLLTSEAADVSFPGVSRAYFSVMAETGWDRVFSKEDNEKFSRLLSELEINEYVQITKNDQVRTWALDFEAINNFL